MPRPALKNVSTAALQAEIERRVSKLNDLLSLRDDVDHQIAELKALAGQVALPAPAAGKKKVVRRRRRRKVKPVAKKKGVRGSYKLTATDFVMSLLEGGKSLTTSELIAAWKDSGRGSKVDNALTALVKAGKVKRSKVKGGMGSVYSLAGASPKPAAKPVAKKKVAKKPTAKKKVVKKPAKRKAYSVTAEQFILGLLKEKPLGTKQINEAWKKAGRSGIASPDLSKLLKAGKVKAKPLGGKLGSEYSVV